MFTIFQIIYYFLGKETKLDDIPVGIETILIFIYIFFFFYHHFNTVDQYIYQNYCFWILLGILLYLGGSFFFNLLSNYLDRKYWYITYIIETVKNILFFVGLIVFVINSDKANLDKKPNVPYLDMMV